MHREVPAIWTHPRRFRPPQKPRPKGPRKRNRIPVPRHPRQQPTQEARQRHRQRIIHRQAPTPKRCRRRPAPRHLQFSPWTKRHLKRPRTIQKRHRTDPVFKPTAFTVPCPLVLRTPSKAEWLSAFSAMLLPVPKHRPCGHKSPFRRPSRRHLTGPISTKGIKTHTPSITYSPTKIGQVKRSTANSTLPNAMPRPPPKSIPARRPRTQRAVFQQPPETVRCSPFIALCLVNELMGLRNGRGIDKFWEGAGQTAQTLLSFKELRSTGIAVLHRLNRRAVTGHL